MSFENPTPLIVGATGTLDGRRVRVAGRVVVGMEESGETYSWNEFNVVDSFGRASTLVFEETEAGPEWKLFKFIEPLRVMSVSDAAAKRVGDMVDLDGMPTRVTLVAESRVLCIEGQGPDGVEVGDVAKYFNADRGDRMLVVSWTGEEVEFFEGRDLPAQAVAEAFGLPGDAPALRRTSGFSRDTSATKGGNSIIGYVVFAVFAFFSLFSCTQCNQGTTSRQPSRATAPLPAPKKAAPLLRLNPGAQGTLAQIRYTIEGHALVEIARVGTRHDEHEYSLAGGAGERALLINALNGLEKEWHLLQPVTGIPELLTLSPQEAATRRKGAPIPLGGRTYYITSLYQATTRVTDGAGASTVWPPLQYGFIAQDGPDWLVARWTEQGVRFFRGRTVSESDVLTALGPGPGKPR